ncbi:MAG: hypothetical protein IKH33_03090 [Bacteroidales bacterium]|nr:hypothetical protein [Bacteroidales bacterium]
MTKLNKYDSPVIKVVAFKVESGFLTSNPNASSESQVSFGGTYETGGVTDDASTNQSGLGQYGYGSLFGRD